MKKTDLTPELQALLTGSFDLLIGYSFENEFMKERFNAVRQKEEWTESHVEILVSSLTLMVTGYNHEASKEFRIQQDQARKLLKAFLNLRAENGSEGNGFSLVSFDWLKLSEESIFQLNKAYADIYLKRHSHRKNQEVADSIPWIVKTGETMAWFVARIMTVAGRNKALRRALEADLLKAGLKLIESERIYGITEAETSEETTKEMLNQGEEWVSEQKKKGGLQ